MGMLTQPFSLTGLPGVLVPVLGEFQMPLGVQINAPPFREDICFHVAWPPSVLLRFVRGSLRMWGEGQLTEVRKGSWSCLRRRLLVTLGSCGIWL